MADHPVTIPRSLTPLDVLPLHPGSSQFACYYPEKPVNHFDWRCPKCRIAARAYLLAYGDQPKTTYGMWGRWTGMLSEVLELAESEVQNG